MFNYAATASVGNTISHIMDNCDNDQSRWYINPVEIHIGKLFFPIQAISHKTAHTKFNQKTLKQWKFLCYIKNIIDM